MTTEYKFKDPTLAEAWEAFEGTGAYKTIAGEECLSNEKVQLMYSALQDLYEWKDDGREFWTKADVEREFKRKEIDMNNFKYYPQVDLWDYVNESQRTSSSVRVVNAEGTGGEKPDNETSWRKYWEDRTGKNLDDLLPSRKGKYQCPCHDHHEKGDDGYVEMNDICGCHMQKVTKEGKQISTKMFIAPMCRGCNKRKDIFDMPKKFLIELQNN